MRISSVSLTNFRNIAYSYLEPGDGVNLIIGDNAQGKTNLLEAIYLFTGQGSFRSAKEAEMIMRGAKNAKAAVAFTGGGRKNNSDIILGEGRAALLNGIELKSNRGLMGSLLAVVFSPGHLSLVKGGPSLRRAFLDDAIAQLKPRYAQVLQQYNRILSQRAAVLRDAGTHSALLDTLDTWDSSLARLGGLIVRTRESYVERLSPLAAAVHDSMSAGRESLEVIYTRSFSSGSNAEEALAKELNLNRAADLKNGYTSVGPHRDDLNILISGAPARSYASQGQQRSAVICLMLAEATLMTEISGDRPVVLLDDVLSELDDGRRDFLLNGLEGWQVFITCCDRRVFPEGIPGEIFFVNNGAVARITPKQNE